MLSPVSKCLLVAGVIVLSMALRSFSHPGLFRLGNLCVLAGSYLAGWFLTGHQAGGVLGLLLWILLPWIDILGRIRRVRIPTIRKIQAQAPPNRSRFPDLEELTEEIEEEGFSQIEDAGWDQGEQQQFVRVFVHAQEPVRATLNLVENEEISFYYVTLCTRGQDGRNWYTWDYPFTPSLKSPGNWRVQKVPGGSCFLELLERHRHWIQKNNIGESVRLQPDPVQLTAQLEEEIHAQVLHNQNCGLLTTEAGFVRYSWKGCFFLWWQFLKEILRVN